MDNLELVRHLATTSGPLEPETLERLVDPDIELDLTVRTMNPTVYRGYEGVTAYYEEQAETWSELKTSVEEAVEEGDRVLTRVSAVLVGRASGIEIEPDPGWQVWRLRGGRALSMRLFLDEAEARAAFGA